MRLIGPYIWTVYGISRSDWAKFDSPTIDTNRSDSNGPLRLHTVENGGGIVQKQDNFSDG